MLKIPKDDKDLKLRNCSAGFLFLLRFELSFVFARGGKLEADDQIATKPQNRAVGSSPHLLSNGNERFHRFGQTFIG